MTQAHVYDKYIYIYDYICIYIYIYMCVCCVRVYLPKTTKKPFQLSLKTRPTKQPTKILPNMFQPRELLFQPRELLFQPRELLNGAIFHRIPWFDVWFVESGNQTANLFSLLRLPTSSLKSLATSHPGWRDYSRHLSNFIFPTLERRRASFYGGC